MKSELKNNSGLLLSMITIHKALSTLNVTVGSAVLISLYSIQLRIEIGNVSKRQQSDQRAITS